MTRQQWGGLLAAIVVAWNAWQGGVLPIPGPNGGDVVSEAFDSYEQLWRQTAADAAKRLRDGELTTDTETRDFLAAAQPEMRKIAFKKLAESEGTALQDWTPEKHAKLLESYVND